MLYVLCFVARGWWWCRGDWLGRRRSKVALDVEEIRYRGVRACRRAGVVGNETVTVTGWVWDVKRGAAGLSMRMRCGYFFSLFRGLGSVEIRGGSAGLIPTHLIDIWGFCSGASTMEEVTDR